VLHQAERLQMSICNGICISGPSWQKETRFSGRVASKCELVRCVLAPDDRSEEGVMKAGTGVIPMPRQPPRWVLPRPVFGPRAWGGGVFRSFLVGGYARLLRLSNVLPPSCPASSLYQCWGRPRWSKPYQNSMSRTLVIVSKSD
jgi:hypothetical protein